MAQQYELNLLDAPEDILRRKIFFGGARARGLAVIDVDPLREHTLGHARALKAQPSFLPENSLAADAFRLTLMQCKWHITANMPAVEARDMEGMHQLRVGLRRLRVALSSFGGDFRNPQLEAIRIRAKTLAGYFAPARDFDVFSEELFEPAATANGALDAFEVLRKRAQVARQNAWDDAVMQVTGPGFRGFLGELNEAIDRRLWTGLFPGQGHATKGMLAFETPAARLADRMLTHRLKGTRKRARHLESLSDAQRHDLRISLKKLRYTAEFFAPFYEKRKVEKFLSRLSRMQDVLGALNDVAVARKTLDVLVTTESVPTPLPRAEISFAAGIVYGWHLERAARMWDDAVSRWKKFARTEAFWQPPEER
jgi:CHAD domain-containing protein